MASKFEKQTEQEQKILLANWLNMAVQYDTGKYRTDIIGIATQYGDSYKVKRSDFERLLPKDFIDTFYKLALTKKDKRKKDKVELRKFENLSEAEQMVRALVFAIESKDDAPLWKSQAYLGYKLQNAKTLMSNLGIPEAGK